jgi:hypothetical protein
MIGVGHRPPGKSGHAPIPALRDAKAASDVDFRQRVKSSRTIAPAIGI